MNGNDEMSQGLYDIVILIWLQTTTNTREKEAAILAEMRFLQLYDENEALILDRRREFESNIDIQKTMQVCRELCRENIHDDGEEINNVVGRIPDENLFAELYDNPNADLNDDRRLARLISLVLLQKKKENILSYAEFYSLIRRANDKQREILTHVIHHLISKYEAVKHLLLKHLWRYTIDFQIRWTFQRIYCLRFNRKSCCCHSWNNGA